MCNVTLKGIWYSLRPGQKRIVALLQNKEDTCIHQITLVRIYCICITSMYIRRLDSCPRIRGTDTLNALCILDFMPHNVLVTYAYGTTTVGKLSVKNEKNKRKQKQNVIIPFQHHSYTGRGTYTEKLFILIFTIVFSIQGKTYHFENFCQ